jgi:outer membrane protein
MKNTSTILSALALLGVIVLFVLHFSGKPAADKGRVAPARVTDASGMPAGARIAYIDIDTLEANYEYFKAKREDFTRRQAALETELERSARQLQSEAAAFQQKAQGGSITQAEAESTQKRLLGMQQNLEGRRQSMAAQLMKEQDAFNSDLQKRLDAWLAEYNKNKAFDFVLSYSKSGSILYADSTLDITDDAIRGMNERSKSNRNTSDTSRN